MKFNDGTELNDQPELLKVGDLVKTYFYPEEKDVVRRILNIRSDPNCHSKILIIADGGEKCPCCGRTSKPISGSSGEGIDASWFMPVV